MVSTWKFLGWFWQEMCDLIQTGCWHLYVYTYICIYIYTYIKTNYLGNNTRPTTVGFEFLPFWVHGTFLKMLSWQFQWWPALDATHVTELADMVREIKEHCRYSFFSSMTTWNFCDWKNTTKQGLGLMSLFGDLFHITFKYLLETISLIVGWCETLGHESQPLLKSRRFANWTRICYWAL